MAREQAQRCLEEILFGQSELSDKDEEFLQYLTTCDLNKLAREPEVLRTELDVVEKEMRESVVRDYKSFIQASQCIHNLHSSMDNLANSLKGLTASLSPLPNSCNKFTAAATPLKVDRYVRTELIYVLN